jgi:hypothetical protein
MRTSVGHPSRCALFVECGAALNCTLATESPETEDRNEGWQAGVRWLYLMAMSGSRAGWVLRAARAINRPEPMIRDPPTNMGRPGLSCQTR